MKGNVFATVAKIGVLLLLLCGLLDVGGVIWYIWNQRTLTRAEQQVMELSSPELTMRRQALSGVMREFGARANSDAAVLEILKRNGVVPGSGSAASRP